ILGGSRVSPRRGSPSARLLKGRELWPAFQLFFSLIHGSLPAAKPHLTGVSRPEGNAPPRPGRAPAAAGRGRRRHADRQSVVTGKSVSVRVDLGGRGIIK